MNKNYEPGIFYPPNANIWPHEKKTAESLARAGFYVEFRLVSAHEGENSADCYINGELWELKAPNGRRTAIIATNLRKAKKQAGKVVFDSHRVKRLPDSVIERELRNQINYIKKINHIKFINRHRKIIDIKKSL